MSYSAQVKIMTSDPGARFLGGVADDLKAQLEALKAKVAACCGDKPSVAPSGPQSDASTPPPDGAKAP